MFGLCEEEPAGHEDTGDMAENGDGGEGVGEGGDEQQDRQGYHKGQ